MSLPLHPLARLCPEMDREQFRELKESIQTRGQDDPIVLAAGQVLDGRHRARACEELGIQPKTITYTGDDLLGYVIAKNVTRRHLTGSQRAIVAARIANLLHGGDRSKKTNKIKGEHEQALNLELAHVHP